MTGNAHVVVIGGGYAGVMAANRLMLSDGVTVTLINPRPDLVHRVRLHQLVGGSDDAVVSYQAPSWCSRCATGWPVAVWACGW